VILSHDYYGITATYVVIIGVVLHAEKKVMNILKQSKIKVKLQIAHLQFAHTDTQPENCKRAIFPTISKI